MEKIRILLTEEAKGSVWFCVVFGSCLLIVVTNVFVASLYLLVGIDTPDVIETDMFNYAGLLYFAIVVSVTLEEILFRYLPLMVTLKWLKSRSMGILALVVLSSSIIFGWLHGNVFNILLQGFTGVVFCLVYLKCGGMQNKHLKGLWSSFVAHMTFNLFLVTSALLIMQLERMGGI